MGRSFPFSIGMGMHPLTSGGVLTVFVLLRLVRIFPLLVLPVAAFPEAQADLLPTMTNGAPTEFAPRRAGAAEGANRRIFVSQEGLYRISYTALVSAGVSNPIGSRLRLFCRTQEIALAVSSEGAWGPADYAVFYGWPHDGYWTRTNVYWLGHGGTGERMQTRNGVPMIGWPEATAHWRTVRYEKKQVFVPFYRPQDDSFDHWISHNIFSHSETNIFVHIPHPLPSGSAQIRLALWGRTSHSAFDPDHATRITLNGVVLQTSFFDGDIFFLASNTLPQALFSNGWNSFVFRQLFTGAADVVSLEWLSVSYSASNRVEEGRLGFWGYAGSNNYLVSPWNTNHLAWVLDVSDPARPSRFTNVAVFTSSGTGAVRWAHDSPSSNRYYVSSHDALLEAVVLPPMPFMDLTNTDRRADYLIITHPLLATSAYAVARHRARQGLRPLIVPIDDVFAEFSYGIRDARAIKQFLGYAYHHWRQRPRYVLLVGDGTYDPLNRAGLSTAGDLIPVWLGPSGFEYCAQDGWFACVDGPDKVRDLRIGRLPFRTPEFVSNAIARIIQYEAAPPSASWRGKALYAADTNQPPNYFQTVSDTYILTNLARAGIGTHTRAYFTGANSASVVATITNVINGAHPGGPVFSVSYFGHGWNNDWAVGFNTAHAEALANADSQPFFTIWTCANGAFAHPTNQSMAERLMERPANRGASAVLSASALSVNEAAMRLADGFYGIFTNSGRITVGEAVDRGVLTLFSYSPNSTELLFYNLFGDPAHIIRP